MYLTKIMLDLTDSAVADIVFDCQKAHSFVMSGFPIVDAPAARAELNVLYNLNCADRIAVMLVQSDEAPNIQRYHIDGARHQPSAVCKDVSGMRDAIQAKPQLTFSLFANPTRAVLRENRSSARKFIPDEAGRMEWLSRRLGSCGCQIIDAYEESTETIHGEHKNGRISAVGAHWKGILQVTDPDKFWEAMRKGIGRERAYGMGMLMVGIA